MTALYPKDVADMIEKRLRGKVGEKRLAEWAWEVHWKDETGEQPYDEAHCEVLTETISALAHSETEGFALEENELRELWQKLQPEQLRRKATG